jgi:hypothetical protein
MFLCKKSISFVVRPAAIMAGFFLLSFGIITPIQAQFKFGLRAGINLANVVGPMETDDAGTKIENQALRTRIAVGLTARWKATDRFGMFAELAFVQKGGYYRYEGQSYMRFPELNQQLFVGHNRLMALNITNGYLEVPISAYYEVVNDKLLIEGGITAGFLINSRGLGVLKYIDAASPDDIIEYDLDYRYSSDKAGGVSTASNTTVSTRTGRIGGTTIAHPSSIGAYYFNTVKAGTAYNVFDLSVNAGFSYFLSDGLRFGAKFQYSLLDITNNNYDYSLYKLDANNEPIKRNDIDRNIGVQVFIGLQF